MSFDYISGSEGHRAVLRNLIALYDRTGAAVRESAVAEITPYQHPDGNGRLVSGVIVPEADGSPPYWFSHVFDELAEDGLATLEPGSAADRAWNPTAAARERLRAFDDAE